MENNRQTEIALLKDEQWSKIDGDLCKVTDFVPNGSVKDGKVIDGNRMMPYASINIECTKLQEKTKGLIVHKIDFLHLWMAFNERELQQDEEVIIVWTKKNYKSYAKFLFKRFLPKLQVMICRKGAFELLTNPNYNLNLKGEARWNAEKPIADWKPEVMIN